MTKKKRFAQVTPLTEEAKIYFEDYMFGLHSCIIVEEVESKMFLSSINGNYSFWVNKSGDKNWGVIK